MQNRLEWHTPVVRKVLMRWVSQWPNKVEGSRRKAANNSLLRWDLKWVEMIHVRAEVARNTRNATVR